jgi:amidase
VAAGLVDFALGTDTGGSTRVPASYCGLWGLRTTHGLLPTEGLVPLHPSYDTVTWLAHDRQVFGRVGQVLLPASPFVPKRILRIDDACALADPPFASPVGRVLTALEALLASSPRAWHASTGSSLAEWRQAYMTTGAFEGWQVHGDWISPPAAALRSGSPGALAGGQPDLRASRHRGEAYRGPDPLARA